MTVPPLGLCPFILHEGHSNLMLEKTLKSPLDFKEIKPVHPKGNQAWIFIGRPDAKAETPILWPPDVKNWLIGKDPDAGKDWRQEEKGTAEDEMVGWHHQLDGHEFEQAPGASDEQGSPVCCSPWGHKESDRTEWLNWTEVWGLADPKGEASIHLGFLFLYVLSPSHWACLVQIGLAKKAGCLFHLTFFLQSTDFLLFHFCRLFPFFVF